MRLRLLILHLAAGSGDGSKVQKTQTGYLRGNQKPAQKREESGGSGGRRSEQPLSDGRTEPSDKSPGLIRPKNPKVLGGTSAVDAPPAQKMLTGRSHVLESAAKSRIQDSPGPRR